MMENKELCCAVAKDLLPLYHDGVVSKETETMVETHLRHCAGCHAEYNKLCADLPIAGQSASTKSRFDKMMHRKKRNRLIVMATAVLLACAVVAASIFGMLQLPLVNVKDSEISVLRTYRYLTEDGYRLFILYEYPDYLYTKGDVSTDLAKDTVCFTVKKPIIGRSTGYTNADCLGYSYGGMFGMGHTELRDWATVKFGDTVIWEQSKNANDAIPAYVYVFDEYEFGNGRHTMQWLGYDQDEKCILATYLDGTLTKWDLDGNVIQNTHVEKD